MRRELVVEIYFFLSPPAHVTFNRREKKRRRTKARETDAGLRETRDIKKGTSRFQNPRQGCARGKWQNERKTVRVSYVFAENVQVWYFSQLPSFPPKRYPQNLKPNVRIKNASNTRRLKR